MSVGIQMKTDGSELSVLDLYRWIKEVMCSQSGLTAGLDHKDQRLLAEVSVTDRILYTWCSRVRGAGTDDNTSAL